jgi:putative transposase
MPRKARITVPGAIHHVMARGIEGRPIFRSDDDRSVLKGLIEKHISKSGYLLYGWCFMPNHYHLVIRINEYPLGTFMRSINSPYAQYFRHQQNLRGYLFQDRYKSIVTHDQSYIQEMIRYVHLNPVRGGLCGTLRSLKKYEWCGHSVLMGVRAWGIQNTRDVLKRFGRQVESARTAYESFLAEGIEDSSELIQSIRSANDETENMHHTGCWVIGNREFVQNALKNAELQRIHLSQAALQQVDIASIAEKICNDSGIAMEQLKRKGRSNTLSLTRRNIALKACREHQIPVVAVAHFFNVSPSAVSKMINRV